MKVATTLSGCVFLISYVLALFGRVPWPAPCAWAVIYVGSMIAASIQGLKVKE